MDFQISMLVATSPIRNLLKSTPIHFSTASNDIILYGVIFLKIGTISHYVDSFCHVLAIIGISLSPYLLFLSLHYLIRILSPVVHLFIAYIALQHFFNTTFYSIQALITIGRHPRQLSWYFLV